LHNLVHIAQCERSGGPEQWSILADRTTCPNFTIGSLEEEARRITREIVRSPEYNVGGCAADAAVSTVR